MIALDFIAWQLRGTILIALGYAVLSLLLHVLKIESSRVRATAVLAVLLAAACPCSLPLDVPWYPASEQVVVSTQENSPDEAIREPSELDDVRSTLARIEPSIHDAATRDENIDSGGQYPLASGSYEQLRALRPLAVRIWLLTLASLAGVVIVRYLHVCSQVRHLKPATDEWAGQWQQLLQQAGVQWRIPLLVTQRIGPLLALLPRGFALLIPQAYWQSLTQEQRRAVLRHELAHYARGDVLLGLVLRLAAAPFAWHPLTGPLLHLFDEAAEWACDRIASGEDERLSYARALSQLVHYPPPATSLAWGRSAQSHPLVLRVRRVLSPSSHKDSLMKSLFLTATLLAAGVVSLVQVRLIAQEAPAEKIKEVENRISQFEARLGELKTTADEMRSSAKQLAERVGAHLEKIKAHAGDQSAWSEELRKRVAKMQSGEVAEQLAALDGAATLGDEGLLLCGYAAKDAGGEPRRKAIEIACSLGEEGLPVLVHGMSAFDAEDRRHLAKQLVAHKEKHDIAVFAKLASAPETDVCEQALLVGMEKCDRPLLFLALAAEKNDDQAATIFATAKKKLTGDDLPTFLFAVAAKGPETILVDVVKSAVPLGEAGYPAIAASFKRNHADSRMEIVRQFRQSKIDIERFVVQEALRDSDPTLREAAEKGNAG